MVFLTFSYPVWGEMFGFYALQIIYMVVALTCNVKSDYWKNNNHSEQMFYVTKFLKFLAIYSL